MGERLDSGLIRGLNEQRKKASKPTTAKKVQSTADGRGSKGGIVARSKATTKRTGYNKKAYAAKEMQDHVSEIADHFSGIKAPKKGPQYNPMKKGSDKAYKNAASQVGPAIWDMIETSGREVGQGIKHTPRFIDSVTHTPGEEYMMEFGRDGKAVDFDAEGFGNQGEDIAEIFQGLLGATTFTGLGGAGKFAAGKAANRFGGKVLPDMAGHADEALPAFQGMPPQYPRPTGPIFGQQAPSAAHVSTDPMASAQYGNQSPYQMARDMNHIPGAPGWYQ